MVAYETSDLGNGMKMRSTLEIIIKTLLKIANEKGKHISSTAFVCSRQRCGNLLTGQNNIEKRVFFSQETQKSPW